jgi:hypothetical protein
MVEIVQHTYSGLREAPIKVFRHLLSSDVWNDSFKDGVRSDSSQAVDSRRDLPGLEPGECFKAWPFRAA